MPLLLSTKYILRFFNLVWFRMANAQHFHRKLFLICLFQFLIFMRTIENNVSLCHSLITCLLDDFFNFQISFRILNLWFVLFELYDSADYRFHFHFRKNLTAFQRRSYVKSIQIWWKISHARTNHSVGRRHLIVLTDRWKTISKSTMPSWVSTPLTQFLFFLHFLGSFR